MKNRKINASLIFLAVLFMVLFFCPVRIFAHCDTMGGPVIKDAKAALEKSDVTPVLKWVKPQYEAKLKSAFNKALAEKDKGADAKEYAEMGFFETLIKLHRAGEGVRFSGLKPAGTDLGPAVSAADQALESGSVEELVNLLAGDVSGQIRQRFNDTLEKKNHADESVAAGRQYVESYIEFMHYIERLHAYITGKAIHRAESE